MANKLAVSMDAQRYAAEQSRCGYDVSVYRYDDGTYYVRSEIEGEPDRPSAKQAELLYVYRNGQDVLSELIEEQG